MLHEIVGLTDEPPAKRRWFHDDYFDLFVWQALSGELVRFQLCYGIHSSERALVWQQQGGFFHDGQHDDPPEPLQELMAHFSHAAPTLPKMIRQTVGARLQEFARNDIPTRRREFRRATWQKRLPVAEQKIS
jgi:hypothetical protein